MAILFGKHLDIHRSTQPNYCLVTSAQQHSGNNALKVYWKFKGLGVSGNRWLRLTSNKTPANLYVLGNPAIDYRLAVRFWMYVPAATPDFYLTVGIRDVNVASRVRANGFVKRPGRPYGVGRLYHCRFPPMGRLVNVKDQWVEYHVRAALRAGKVVFRRQQCPRRSESGV